jgi:flavin-binding protein dodecin
VALPDGVPPIPGHEAQIGYVVRAPHGEEHGGDGQVGREQKLGRRQSPLGEQDFTKAGGRSTIQRWPSIHERRDAMSVARVTEITASSTQSFEDAVRVGIERANKTLQNVKGAWIQEQKIKIANGKVAEYRVNMKITFILKD